MQEKLKPTGKCHFCGETFAKASIHRHLATHLKEKAATGNPGSSFFVKVEPHKKMDTFPYFLSLWIDGETQMDEFDSFLRKIWLECCGHLSGFRRREKYSDKKALKETTKQLMSEGKWEEAFELSVEYDDDIEIDMEDDANYVFEIGEVLDYDYDYGSTTTLTITVIDEYPVKADSRIVLLSRNEPFAIMCKDCGEMPATKVSAYSWNFLVYCNKCAQKQARKKEYYFLPVVNSPRIGVCGYDGGTIDKERDGFYQG
jgi:hypothetical protein